MSPAMASGRVQGFAGMKVVAVEQDLVTAWGRGTDACWSGVLTGNPEFTPVTRFSTQAFQSHVAAQVPELDARSDDSLVMQMLLPMLAALAVKIPSDTYTILASTTGEVDLLERRLLGGAVAADASRMDKLLSKIREALALSGPGCIVSSACTSSSAAVAHAAALIAAGARDSVLVVACDAVTEFIYSGFSALMALDPDGARPFDRARKGLTIGEAAGHVLLMSEARAQRESRRIAGEVMGWGMSCDANHMTGPARDGSGLVCAIRKSLKKAGLEPRHVGSVSAHGTGTVYNDAMEMSAFRKVFGDVAVPVYSVKGSIGHTMGAAGLVEMVMALKSLEEGVIPPSANVAEVDPEARGWVSGVTALAPDMQVVLSTNSGFGGVNAALVLKR
jgi:3-oxoacyl-[acyl-carrier-protein] synthase II